MSNNFNETLANIINTKNGSPTIVNEQSSFVVVTYWWGRNIDNANTARPCIGFYEDLLNSFNKYINNLINTTIKTKKIKKDDYSTAIEKIYKNVYSYLNNETRNSYSELDKIIDRFSSMYMNGIYDYCDVKKSSVSKDDDSLKWLENLKQQGKTPTDFEFKNKFYVENIFRMVLKEALRANKDNLIVMYLTNVAVEDLKYKYNNNDSIYKKNINELNFKITYFKENLTVYNCAIESDPSQSIENLELKIKEEEEDFLINGQNTKTKIIELNNKKKEVKDKIKYALKNKSLVYTTESGFKTGESIIDILISELRYVIPLKFEKMIERWEKNCRDNNCNYLSIEYPEFTAPGGYQLAINAKPKFIKKALELCPGRSVLYIDGDMNIRKYPGLFDYAEIDYMARGWWIDPRASYQLEESIMYDPYIFETSGGTMFFSQSPESKKLISMWIETAESPYQQGKADDRIISLIFNTKSALTWLRIIQLPIEYLWLTLDYDERMMESVYSEKGDMDESIFIDHPECLTSEDTASGAGASSDRTPAFYSFLEELTPCSEEVHEYILFKDLINKVNNTTNISQEIQSDIVNSEQDLNSDTNNLTQAVTLKNKPNYLPFFKNYFEFMAGAVYLDDGNAELVEFGFVDPENPDDNIQPLYIIPYDDKFGNKKVPGEDVSYNELVEITIKRSKQMNIDSLYTSNDIIDNSVLGCVEIQNVTKLPDNKIIALIYRLLSDGKCVIYNPINVEGYNPALYQSLISKITGTAGMYKFCNFIFNPNILSQRKSNFFKPKIMYNQPMYFRPDSFLLDFLSMQLSLDSLSDMINNGSYEFMSLVRVGYYFVIRPPRAPSGGGGEVVPHQLIDKYIKDYEDGMVDEETSTIPIQSAGNKKRSRRKKIKSKKKTKIRSRRRRIIK
jgi:hypothetical protein